MSAQTDEQEEAMGPIERSLREQGTRGIVDYREASWEKELREADGKPLQASLSVLASRLDELNTAIRNMEDQLFPILRPTPSTEESYIGESPMIEGSPATQQIHVLDMRVRGEITRLQDLMNRSDV